MDIPKVTIVGAGLVGGAAALLVQLNIPGCKVVVIDIENKRAESQALDIAHANALWSGSHIHAGDFDDSRDSSIIVIAAGVAMKPGQTRLDLINTNLAILKSLLGELRHRSPDAIYVLATNPVDILTYVARETLDLPPGRVISTGTALDSARLRTLLSERLDVVAPAIQANVLGEHGDSSIVHWSAVTVDGTPLDHFLEYGGKQMDEQMRDDLEQTVRDTAYAIKQGKGATYYGIGSTIARICQAILHDMHIILPVSMTHEFVCDHKDVCLSLPALITHQGAVMRTLPMLNDREFKRLAKSAEILKRAQDSVVMNK